MVSNLDRRRQSFRLITNARILKKKHFTKANIVISKHSGRIIRIFKSTLSNRWFVKHADEIYDAEGYWALPGIVDMHVHFREPGEEYKEDFMSGSAAAAAGGVTFVADMPNNEPPINTVDRLKKKAKKIEDRSFVNYSLFMGLPEAPKRVLRALESKIKPLAFKIYYYKEREKEMIHSGDLPKTPLYFVHPEDPELLREEKYDDYEGFEANRPVKAEVKSIKNLLEVAREGYRIHLTHITSKKSLELIKRGKKKNLPISADVTPHHLLLDMEKIDNCQSAAKCYPPLRRERDRRALFEGVINGRIDAIASDHAPHHPREKSKGINDAPAGISGEEFILPLILTLTRSYRRKMIHRIVRSFSFKPAKLLGLNRRGRIKTGNFADIVIYNPSPEWTIKGKETFSKGKITPYEGMKVKGKVESTFVNGKLTFHQGDTIEPIGSLISPQREGN